MSTSNGNGNGGSNGQGQGGRKVRHAREAMLMLFGGFLVAGWIGIPTEMFGTFVLGLGGLSGAFMWGNVKEHQATQPKGA